MTGPSSMTVAGTAHTPVLAAAVLAALRPQDGATYVDGTYGAGGYSRALLHAARCRVYGIDRDPSAIAAGRGEEAASEGRLVLIEGQFGEMVALLAARGVAAVDGVALDLGVSSMQLDRSERGFSFRNDGPLDMRMSQSGESAADVVNGADERELADVIFRYGEERKSRRIARAIVDARRNKRIERTGELAAIVRRAAGSSGEAIDPATRTFQALRIHINDELGELERGLDAAETILAAGGRVAVVSFHSLEDRIVKDFMRNRSGAAARGSRHAPAALAAGEARTQPTLRVVTRKPIEPEAAEIATNPRARSARLRVAEKLAGAAA
jgi:16S rRNA (cytosine1402-N4)-methyltransferase